MKHHRHPQRVQYGTDDFMPLLPFTGIFAFAFFIVLCFPLILNLS
jgi:hypothetical protein